MGLFYTHPSFWFSVGGALTSYVGLNLGKVLSPVRPAIVGGLKESYTFKNWITGKVEMSKEDIEDMVAEAKHSYEEELTQAVKSIEREKELLEKVDKVVKKRVKNVKKKSK